MMVIFIMYLNEETSEAKSDIKLKLTKNYDMKDRCSSNPYKWSTDKKKANKKSAQKWQVIVSLTEGHSVGRQDALRKTNVSQTFTVEKEQSLDPFISDTA